MKTILSIQSHVAYGYVGNRAAVFPLQLQGHDVITINTVQFSNHTGYGQWTGQIFDPAHIEDLLKGIEARGAFKTIDAVLSGYLGDANLGNVVLDTVAKIRAINPNLIYCCDPVMGDTGRGFFVRDTIPPFFRDRAVPSASIATPNQFELNALTGVEIKTRDDALRACRTLHDRGTKIVVVTSLETAETESGTIQMLTSHTDGRKWIVTTPRLPLDPTPNGAGDLTAALYLGHTLNGATPDKALSLTASGVFDVFRATRDAGTRELALIPSQDRIKKPSKIFKAKKL